MLLGELLEITKMVGDNSNRKIGNLPREKRKEEFFLLHFYCQHLVLLRVCILISWEEPELQLEYIGRCY